MANSDLTGKLVVVTNATGGIGLGIARRFAECGARVIATDGSEQPNESIRELRGQGLDIMQETLDVRRPIQVASLVERLATAENGIDVWVNVPGRELKTGPAEEILPSDWDIALGTNLSGTFHCCQVAGKQMLAQGSGVIVNVASVKGLKVIEGHVANAVTDAGIFALTNALGVEWAARGVRVVAVAVGPNETTARGTFAANEQARFDPTIRVPLHREGTGQEIADVVLFVASSQASFITAETVRVDGGWSAYQLF